MNKYSWLVGLVNLTVMACGNNPAPCGCPASTITIDSNGEFVKNLTCSGSACDGCSVESWGSQPLPHSFDYFEPEEDYYNIGIGSGECDVQVELYNGGRLQRSFVVTHQEGVCCGDFVTGSPWSLDAASVDAG